MRKLIKFGFLVVSVAISGAVQAGIIYNVTSTPTINCGTSSHGLWTNSYSSAGCDEYFDFQPGSTLHVNDIPGGTAVLKATALSQSGQLATIDITFGGFNETYGFYKNGGSPDYDGDDDPVDWDFFNVILDGMISFTNGDEFDVWLVNQTPGGAASSSSPVLQIGDGANDKSTGIGASSWLDAYQTKGGTAAFTGNARWDLNMSLSPVPEPSALALLTLSLASLGLMRRRRQSLTSHSRK